jgi:hypothetical protein
MSSIKITDLPELIEANLDSDDFILVIDDSEVFGSKDKRLKISSLDARYVRNSDEFAALFTSSFNTKTTDDLQEGTKLYWTDARFDASLFNKSTNDLSEGDNKYYTDARVSANTDVAANTNKRHDAVTLVGDSGLSLDNQELTLARASASQNGYLDKTDFDVFTKKVTSSPSDIPETSFDIAEGQGTSQDITGFTFDNDTTRAFEALVSVEIDADTDLTEFIKIYGVQNNGSWTIVRDPLDGANLGDDTNINFSIATVGTTAYVRYTSGTYTGFVSGKIKFRALTTSI